jgi:D-hydroxyproline dehydrogenase subunit alpha
MRIVVVGAGIVNAACARILSSAGATARVLEASNKSGGQYWRHLPATRPGADEPRLHHQWRRHQKLRSTIESDPALTVDLGPELRR